ncbi:pyranose oxidase [Allostreptomyces psammosilenae]|uniref:Pyranose 2-oxidase n=1 Tax=Allostreptomyces psammosilenae TaxID=1892865 RepID=A0A853A091_9ACTN|nr:pyranose oxidase [Allostreptomyces psammosilenae]NYI06880.1 pyranose oxidase [Allostreptomyces psammosilenae]
MRVDTLIIGSGPVGATYARVLEAAGQRVAMVDAGAQHSPRFGEHLKNAVVYQRNRNLFSSVIRGHLNPLSVSVDRTALDVLDPAATGVNPADYGGGAANGQNPGQDPHLNIPGAAATYAVGGMATHWTCATPRHHPTVERTDLISEDEWEDLYREAEDILGTSVKEFSDSVTHNVVLDVLREEYGELPEPYGVQSLPLAVRRRRDSPHLVHWTGTDAVFGKLATPGASDNFTLLPQHLCTRLVRSSDGHHIRYAEVQDLLRSRTLRIRAENYVVAGGAVLTPQLLFASGITPEPLGRYLTEQPVAFCQVVLLGSHLEAVRDDALFWDRVRLHMSHNPDDPVPIPRDDLDPQVWIPVSPSRPWHCQIHRDAFHYGDGRPNVDERLIVDLRWFGIVEPRRDNRVVFSERHRDMFGMPQPTFEFSYSAEDRHRQHAMMADMLRAASALGGFLPGSEPRFTTLGIPLHITGTTRMGDDPETSVADPNSQVWFVENLYVGGNGVIPRGTASNPTLTSMAFALKSARHILRRSDGAA